MRKLVFFFAAFCLMANSAFSQNEIVTGVKVDNYTLERNGKFISLDMTLDVSNLKVKRNKAVLLTPCIYSGSDSLHLKSIGIYGRKRYYHYLRNNGTAMLSGDNEMTYRKGNMPSIIEYHDIVPYETWMGTSKEKLHRYLYGCCNQIIEEQVGELGIWMEPNLIYIRPEVEPKTRALEGSAFIDFPLDKTTIHPEYHNNTAELAKISATIDSIGGDCDFTINDISLKGYASPEGPYKHNVDLSIERVNALKTYIQKLHSFSSDEISIANEPEDWEGLKKYVETSNLEHKAEILEMIDSNLEPDAKEAKIKATYPSEYNYLLKNCYPELRRTDYKVNYTIREFSDIDEIKNMYNTFPNKLSLSELYQLAETYEPGSDEYNEIFALAAKLYPDDEVANLNAANVALKNKDIETAKNHLSKAGSSSEAEYARGVLAYMQGNLTSAIEYMQKASDNGIMEAKHMLDSLK
ncbi:MAG: DUF3868 domain-containing protein [Prevotella sp.]|nr:DUF3868 domain-containing protein [Prevotella sp.]